MFGTTTELTVGDARRRFHRLRSTAPSRRFRGNADFSWHNVPPVAVSSVTIRNFAGLSTIFRAVVPLMAILAHLRASLAPPSPGSTVLTDALPGPGGAFRLPMGLLLLDFCR